MRGLRLFVRPIEPADQSDVDAFLQRESGQAGEKAPEGLLGKLLGDIVAVVALDIGNDALRIDDIVVRREYRRKWIGRTMLREVEQLAAKLHRPRIVVEDAGEANEFFRRVGFHCEGERWVRDVSQSS